MSEVTLRVNGAQRTVDVDPAAPLLYVLRNDLELRGPRFGCGLGQCGACTVLIDGTPTRSCVTPAKMAWFFESARTLSLPPISSC
jgi:nicotinate dehydrogenase subunit A